MVTFADSRIKHEILGNIRGETSEDSKTIQFRNIKYGSIPGRWQDPVLLSQKMSEIEFDATIFGPSCPQKAGGVEFDLRLIGDVQLPHDTIYQSEFDCLNLVVTVPNLASISSLPVMVWKVLLPRLVPVLMLMCL